MPQHLRKDFLSESKHDFEYCFSVQLQSPQRCRSITNIKFKFVFPCLQNFNVRILTVFNFLLTPVVTFATPFTRKDLRAFKSCQIWARLQVAYAK